MNSRSLAYACLTFLLVLTIPGCGSALPFPGADPQAATVSPAVTPSREASATRWPTVTRSAPTGTPTPTRTSTSAPVICPETQGIVLTESFQSGFTGRAFRYRIYLPPCYATSGRAYPVLFLLHGFDPASDSLNDEQWDRLGVDEAASLGFLAGAIPPFIIVMPNGNDAWYGDDTSDSAFPQVVVEELIPWVDAHYCTWGEASGRAIGGLSRGGYWALYIAFRYPDLFSRVGAHSPYLYAPYDATSANPFNLVDAAPGIEALAMYFDHGTSDYALVSANTAEFVSRLGQRGIVAQYVVNEDDRGHTDAYWSAHVAEYLAFYSAGWPLDAGTYPLCVASP